MVKIGVLDYAQIDEGKTAKEALEETITLARLADFHGFERFWVAEHHNVPAFASSSPELLMMRIADATNSIRVGSGGVMLPHYSPYKVAENFRILESFHPNRIDLGFGNNAGTSLVNRAMNENKKAKLPVDQSVADLIAYFNDTINQDHRFSGITANPVTETNPQMFALSTSMKSALMAASAGIGYTFGLFPFAGTRKLDLGPEIAKTYRKEFKPSLMLSKPNVIVAAFVAIADTKEEAEKYATALDLWLLGKDAFSALKNFPSVETAKNFTYLEKDREIMKNNRNYLIHGDPNDVKAQINDLALEFNADEILLIPLIPGFDARKRAYELIAETFI